MQVLTTYNAISAGFDAPFAEITQNPIQVSGILEDFNTIGPFTSLATVASGGSAAASTTASFGAVVLTPNATGGCRLAGTNAGFLPAAGKPVFFLARAQWAVGRAFIGIAVPVAANSGALNNAATPTALSVRGAGFLITATGAVDAITFDGTNSVRNQAVATVAVNTYATFGVQVNTTSADFYVNGKRVSSAAIAAGIGSTNYTPTFEASNNVATNTLTVDYCVVAQER